MDGSDGEPDYRFDITHPERFGNFHIDSWHDGVYKLFVVSPTFISKVTNMSQHLQTKIRG